MHKIALCDNNPNYLQHLEAIIKSYCQKKGIFIYLQLFTDSDALMDYIEEKNMFDIYILEVDMPCYSGIDIARKIREPARQLSYSCLLIPDMPLTDTILTFSAMF